MLSYRHAFHAGNHADVLKHLVEVLVLQYMVQKADKPLCYIDTHAGPGEFDLRDSFARKNREFDTGITRLWDRTDAPVEISQYLETVRSFNSGGKLLRYPGSPAIAAKILRREHRLHLCELHPADAGKLARWASRDRRIGVEQRDGFAALKALLPPVEKRALVMIDPPYEVKTDYANVVTALRLAIKKFATGVYILWYPLLEREQVALMTKKLQAMPVKYLLAELHVQAPAPAGMYGSGVVVINPPWVLQEQLQCCLPYLQATLATAEAEPFVLHSTSV